MFEHLRQPAETLGKIHEILRPGGVLFLSMPNHESWQGQTFGKSWFHLDPPRHLHGFGVKSLTRLLHDRGFDLAWTTTWSFEQNPYGIMQSILNAMGFPRDRAYSTLKGTNQGSSGDRLVDVALLAALTGPGLAMSAVEALLGRGGTMTVVSRKR